MEKQDWHAEEINTVLHNLETNRKGLNEEQVSKKLELFGPNELKEEKKTTPLELFIGQFKSILVIILIISALVSAYISFQEGEAYTDTYVILIIVVMNAILGFVQEYRAEQAVEALKRMVSPQVLVVREGLEKSIDSKGLVPGDIILLEAGSRVPADSRLIEAANLQVDEAALTGESTPVTKNLKILSSDTGIGDRKNSVFMGTVITGGRAIAVVTETGMRTEFGKIAGLVQAVEVEEPPLKQKMERMGRQLGAISVILTIWVFLIGIFIHQTELERMFMMAVSLAVSAIPEGLPAVLTITLALGVSRMARQKAIVRKLASVETLGSTTVICSDKTGTLTKNEMTVKQLSYGDCVVDISGSGYEPVGEFSMYGEQIGPLDDPDRELLIRIGFLNNDSHLQQNENGWVVFGDPTEGALTVLGVKAGFGDETKKTYPRVAEFPFDSTRKMMSTIHEESNNRRIAYVKGAPEVVLERCVSLFENGSTRRINEQDKEHILFTMQGLASDALRVLAMAFKEAPFAEDYDIEDIESGLTFVGLVGMIDPAREEVPQAIRITQQAGIKSIMVTGDHKLTAVAIAKEIGMLQEEIPGSVITGDELENIIDEKLDEVIEDVSVFARVSPEHKMRIALSLKRNGHIVAMTGDGVNDAPALKAADIGVAMGIKGTDVTKEASDMILEDDNFATIVRAIQGGRHIYDNVSKYLRLMLAANFDEFIEITVVTLLGLPLPFLPIHVLWVNLVTDGLPAVALSIDPPDPDLMKYPPRDPDEGLLKRFWRFIIFAALLDFISDFVPFMWAFSTTWMATGNYELAATTARTIAFTSIVFFEFFLAYQCRSETHHIFSLGWKGVSENKMLFISIGVSFILQMAILYIPALNPIFKVVPLTPFQLFVCFIGSLTAFLILPGKLIPRRRYVSHRKISES